MGRSLDAELTPVEVFLHGLGNQPTPFQLLCYGTDRILPAKRIENNVTLIGEQFNEKRFCRKNFAVVVTPGPLSLLITVRAERRVADGVQVAPFLERDYPGGIRWYGAYPISYRQL